MKYVTIVRHAKSSWENSYLKDIERPLATRGINDIPKVGAYLAQQQIKPDVVLSSPANRAFETAKGICSTINYDVNKIEIEEQLYYGNKNDIIALLKTLNNNYSDVFVFSHEPKCSYLIELLTGVWLDKFPTCATYRIAFNITDWKMVQENIGKKVFFVFPKMF